jgi:hypothetical protein
VTPPIVQAPTVFLPKRLTWDDISQPYVSGKVANTAPG